MDDFIRINYELTQEEYEKFRKVLANARLELLPIEQPEITEEEVREYCRKRGLIVLTSEAFYSLKHEYDRGMKDGYTRGFRDATVKFKDEEYRWNGGGNY